MSVTAIKDSFNQPGHKWHHSEAQDAAQLLDTHLEKGLAVTTEATVISNREKLRLPSSAPWRNQTADQK